MRLALILLAGCNQVFGLEHVQRTPDRFDAPLDSAITCPTSGVPMFKADPHEVTAQVCHSYTTSTSASLAAIDCAGGPFAMTDRVYLVAPADTDPTPSNATTVFHNGSLASTLLGPEGNQLWITYYPPSASLTLVSYANDGTGWKSAPNPTLPMGFDNNDRFSRPSAGTGRHALQYHAIDQTWYELAEGANGAWTTVRTHPELATDATAPRLSADGLRLVASQFQAGFDAPVYASRATLADAFTAFAPIATAPMNAGEPFFSDDCTKLYYSATTAIYYVERL